MSAIGIPTKGDLALIQQGPKGLHGLFLVDSYDVPTTTLTVYRVDIDPTTPDENWPIQVDVSEIMALYNARSQR